MLPVPQTSHGSVQPDSIIELTTILRPLSLTTLFAKEQPIEVELGSGDGSFLINYAAANSQLNFIGVERLLGRLNKTARKTKRLALANIKLIRIESSYFLKYLLPPGSISAIHVYFPDPWPKKKHRRHRLINEAFPGLAFQSLKPGGYVHLRTDDLDYFEQMKSVFAENHDFVPVKAPGKLLDIKTDFEREFHSKGIPTFEASYCRSEG